VIFRRVIASVFTAGLLASCSIVPSATEAFTAADSTWSREKFNAFLSELIQAGQIESGVGGASGQDARGVATILIRQEVTNDFLQSQGEAITAADRAALLENVASNDPFYSYSETLQDVLLQINAGRTALDRVKMPSSDALSDLYNTLPARAGVACISHIVVSTRDDANSALKRVKGGEKFADVAKDVSLEPAAQQTGGALASEDNPCFTLDTLRQANFDPLFVAGVLSARAGIPTGPVKSTFGYHIILNAPWNEVSEAVIRLVEGSPGVVLNEGHLFASSISVSSSIGRWNTISGQVE